MQDPAKSLEFAGHTGDMVRDGTLTQPVILVVDDDKKDLQKMVAQLSSGVNATLFQATNLKDALALLREQHIDLVISDIVMPEFRLTQELYEKWVKANIFSHDYTVALEQGRVKPGGFVPTIATRSRRELAGFKLLKEARKVIPWLDFIVVTRYADFEMAREALHLEVQEILSKAEVDSHPNILRKKVSTLLTRSRKILAKLSRADLLKVIRQLDEQDFTRKVLMPLLHRLGFGGIRYTHGANECGIDLLFYSVDPLGRTRYVGAQVKVENIVRKAGCRASNNVMRIVDQAHVALESTWNVSSEMKDVELDRFLVITSHSFTGPARRFLLRSARRRTPVARVDWLDGEDIVDLFTRNRMKRNTGLFP